MCNMRIFHYKKCEQQSRRIVTIIHKQGSRFFGIWERVSLLLISSVTNRLTKNKNGNYCIIFKFTSIEHHLAQREKGPTQFYTEKGNVLVTIIIFFNFLELCLELIIVLRKKKEREDVHKQCIQQQEKFRSRLHWFKRFFSVSKTLDDTSHVTIQVVRYLC